MVDEQYFMLDRGCVLFSKRLPQKFYHVGPRRKITDSNQFIYTFARSYLADETPAVVSWSINKSVDV